MELSVLLEILFFGLFMWLPMLAYFWMDNLFHICRRIGMLYFTFLYFSLLVLVLGIDFILEEYGVWESASVYVLQLLS